jgi:Flp pilus assembly protein TadG
MVVQNRRRQGRSAAAAVEAAVVLMTTLMFMMAVFEYGRLLMDWNLLNNAAREGCRYALANNTGSTVSTDVTNIVTGYMATEISSFTGFSVTISGTSNGAAKNVNDLAPGDLITVTVTGTYTFMNIIPLITMPTSITITSAPVMVVEGVT